MSVNTFVQRNMADTFLLRSIWGAGRMPFEEGGVPMTNARAGQITATTRAGAALELLLCVRVMAQEVLFP